MLADKLKFLGKGSGNVVQPWKTNEAKWQCDLGSLTKVLLPTCKVWLSVTCHFFLPSLVVIAHDLWMVMLSAIMPAQLAIAYVAAEVSTRLEPKELHDTIRTCMQTLLNQYTTSHYLAICINQMQLHEVTS